MSLCPLMSVAGMLCCGLWLPVERLTAQTEHAVWAGCARQVAPVDMSIGGVSGSMFVVCQSCACLLGLQMGLNNTV
jgi:hypothetical protein